MADMNTGTELWKLGAAEAARLVRHRTVRTRDVLRSLRTRRDAVNGAVNAIVADILTADRDAALADDACKTGSPRSALHGVPISVKVNIDVLGQATSSGSAMLGEAVATADAPVIERLRAAGGVPFARTNMPDFGLRNHTESSLFGRTRNPWDPARTAGGSSGGEAVAVATGMSPLGVGNDVAGSLRNPAHCCGVVGFKPSTGLVPNASSLAPRELPITYQLMLAQGFIARRVEDVRLALEVTRGVHRRDPLALPVEPPDREGVPRRLRVAVATDPPGGASDPAVRRAIDTVAALLDDAGHVVNPAHPLTYDRSAALTWELLVADFRAMREGMDALLVQQARTITENVLELMPPRSAEQIAGLHLERSACDLDWHEFFFEWDVLLTPVSPTLAVEHGDDVATIAGTERTIAGLAPLLPANLLGLPAIAVPVGVHDGLPVGVQFVARRFQDQLVLAAAQAVEDRLGTFTPIDPVALRRP
jgi:amidase